MKATNNVTSNTQKPSQDIRNNALFTNITAEEEVFVRGGHRVGHNVEYFPNVSIIK